VRESEIDGNSATFFFLEPVSVDPGQSLYESSFTVIDMPRRAYNDRFHLAGILPEKREVTIQTNGDYGPTQPSR
jgi:hypothetical protein